MILPGTFKSEGLLKTRGIAWLGLLKAKRVGAWDFSPKLPSDYGSHEWLRWTSEKHGNSQPSLVGMMIRSGSMACSSPAAYLYGPADFLALLVVCVDYSG